MEKKNETKKEIDKAQEALDLYHKEQKEFENHWVWKELDTQPEKFFAAVKDHVKTLNVSKDQWDRVYNKVRQSQRIRALEKRNSFNANNFNLMGALRV